MTLRKSLFALVVMVAGLFCRPALAWNSIGHMTVAYVAYQKLSPAEQARVAVLLQLNPYYTEWLTYLPAGTSDSDRALYVFMMAATWPDEIKARTSGYTGSDTAPAGELPTLNDGYDDKQAHKYWHYVDKPLRDDHADLPPLQVPMITQKIGVLRAALASSEPDPLKSYDLVWLEHLVGDVHQPLHATTRVSTANPKGDAGGNLLLIDGKDKELHAFWDNLLGEGATKNFMTAVKVAATLPKPKATQVRDMKEDDWAAESFALARKSVYAKPIASGLGPYTLTPAYTAQAQKIARQRVSLAGARLANLLKAALQCGDTSCAN
ncbi:MAG TPA: S1/P1 nuclease [Terracidiphilus sp.]